MSPSSMSVTRKRPSLRLCHPVNSQCSLSYKPIAGDMWVLSCGGRCQNEKAERWAGLRQRNCTSISTSKTRASSFQLGLFELRTRRTSEQRETRPASGRESRDSREEKSGKRPEGRESSGSTKSLLFGVDGQESRGKSPGEKHGAHRGGIEPPEPIFPPHPTLEVTAPSPGKCGAEGGDLTN